MKKTALLLLSSACLLLSACNKETSSSSPSSSDSSSSEQSSSSSTSSNSEEPIYPGEVTYSLTGVEDGSYPQGRFFDPYFGVKATSSEGEDVTSELTVYGNVDYGTPGEYALTYDLFGELTERHITIVEDPDFGKVDEPYIYSSSTPYVISTGRPVSGEYKDSSYASYITDGDMSTRYESPWEEGPFDLIIDLGAELPFTNIKLYFENASAKAYDISVSEDGESYSTLISEDGLAYGARTDSWDVDGYGRYVKITLRSRNMEAYGYSLYEVEVYGTRGLAIPTQDYPDLFFGSAINDEQWVKAEFGTYVDVDKVDISYSDWVSAQKADIYGETASGEVLLASTESSQTSFSFGKTAVSSITIKLHSRPLNSKNYRINLLTISCEGTNLNLNDATLSCSDSEEGHGVDNVLSDYNTFWGSPVDPLSQYGQVFDLGKETKIGDVDLLWNSNYGKVYDVYFVSTLDELEGAEPVYRELSGYSTLKTISVYRTGRYLVVKDYSNPNENMFQLSGISIHSALPSGGVVDYEIGELPVGRKVEVGGGSYYTGDPAAMQTARGIGYASESLSGKAIDSNSWWNSLLINNYGHANYMNPLRAKFTSDGLKLSNPGPGYFESTWKRSQQVSSAYDFTISPSNVSNPVTTVLDYDDFGVKVSYGDGKYDSMVASLYQGATAVYAYFASKAVEISSSYELNAYSLDGKMLSAGELTSDSIVISMEADVGYENDLQDGVNPIKYETHYWLLSLPEGSSIDYSPDGVCITLGSGNYLSASALPELSAASTYQQHAYAFLGQGHTYYQVDGQDVNAQYVYAANAVRDGYSAYPILTMLPHQYKRSSTPTTDYSYQTIRGTMKAYIGDRFATHDVFPGIVPTYDEPTDPTYSHDEMVGLLQQYDERTEGNLLSADAYWQGKSLHPLAQAVYQADNLGESALRDSFLSKIRAIFEDWLSYDGEGDSEYLYYDSTWGTMYYATSEFGANYNLADHHFTYGYFAMALTPLFEFDEEARSLYEDMARLIVLDYMNYTSDESMFCRFRNFDFFPGHSWAGGYADSDSGNNQESASESLSSYASAYELSMVLGDEQMRDAAIYCYTTELSAIKQYWFNYDGDSFGDTYPYHVAGQIYGGTNFYGTFFNGDPTYIYGIQWLPSAEYLSGYAYGQEEAKKLEELYDHYVEEEEEWTGHAAEDGYQHILFALIAFFDPDRALQKYNERFDEISGNSEVFNVYYMIHALKSKGVKDPSITAKGDAACSIYTKSGQSSAVVWNPSSEDKTVVFYQGGEAIGEVTIAAHTLTSVSPFGESVAADRIETSSPFALEDAYASKANEGSVTYRFKLNLLSPGYIHLSVINATDAEMEVTAAIGELNYSGSLNVPASTNADLLIRPRVVGGGFVELSLTVPDGLLVLSIYFA